MKNKILIYPILILGFAMILFGCKKDEDFTNPENLSGTVWNTNTNNEWNWTLKFTSKTMVELWLRDIDTGEYDVDESGLEAEGFYTVEDGILEITSENDDYNGSIDGTIIHLNIYGDLETFTKQ
ncbi:MAG: hypothetical protein A2W90_04925 [Bacteroidetes bacterium GWF2_42_66]|nr:MAG: hypothetical protein A2W89_21145 [Bacteroidetes bacterium GWE2_42_39]OFY40828.1 MAG: hypothetical protein A2W90_04925 [Bacteroidetes bacterium GWF2_42_66]HAZ00599.1 hypothetical protein [Marinilabiliales bacterium]HBL75849.1 hypothetical protein [Prolixibacteraceae bacterium]HCU63098.1 hypothetical protein [Prolixibacteraceae bacterium]